MMIKAKTSQAFRMFICANTSMFLNLKFTYVEISYDGMHKV
jgi:hypothetical protein